MESEVNGILVAAHELKAPLNLLRQLAFSLDFAEDEKDVKLIQNKMINVSDRALRQVQDLTKIARLEDGLFEMEPVAVRAVCDEVTEELRTLFRFNHRNLEIEYRNKTRLVSANRELLYSIVYNFCLNAMHYSDEETRSELTLSDKDGKVRLDVRDFGPALPMDVWRSLKKGWVEKPTSIAMRPGSSGLGLYIASKFSQYMNANVGAVRHRDGTSFFVELMPSKQLSLF
ncbi:HAMP domain-containing histidine kinase [Candidatus Saccharibacteria bacterium]|nr:HAMP domain-containing histidine kinase [Candidatus Saccharibacteria bacterium]